MKKVILLEEDRERREALAKILRVWGYDIIQALNESAVHAALVSARPVDLILAGATYRDRLEFLSDLRSLRQFVPIVFLPDYRDPGSRQRGLRYGSFAKIQSHKFFMNTRPVGLLEFERLLRIIQLRQSFTHNAGYRAA